ncbi:rhomboid family intramembrane serine protease [Mesorhizobium sp. J428]|uniref:rhomboid family intramembrane serine protease n=1 Tax=Mesorhizobium sp. J428 TaxID=2898440 RepID=UPI002150DD3E|nr:rhomboid family intramembrane serine protease [Mesorhizobium sp. J428]MCR5860068.1 rhomboid family intramembrane serine protease [Mesorhizobium sp. J428]
MTDSDRTEQSAEAPDAMPSGRGGREPLFNLPGVVIVFIILCVGIHLARVYVLTPQQNYELILNGAFFPVRYTGGYDLDVYAFTSPFTSSLLHAGWMHLILNMVWMAAFASPLATRIGVVRFVLFWCFATVGSLLLHFAARPDDMVPVIGASGAISGMMGAAARFGFRVDRSHRLPIFAGPRLSLGETLRSRAVLIFLGVWLAINFAAGAGLDLSGSEGSIAWEAHIGGMLAGLFGIGLFDRLPSRASGSTALQ